MRKYIKFLMVLFCSMQLHAETWHRIGIQVETGYHTWRGSSYSDKSNGVLTNIGGIWEWRENHFLSQVGIGCRYVFNSISNMPYEGEFPNMIDTDNDICVYQYRITDKQDIMHTIHVTPHFLVGGQWNYVYFLVGVKFPIAVYGVNNTKGYLETSGKYDNLIVPLQAMNNHYFVQQYALSNQLSTYNMGYIGDFLLASEFGIEIPHDKYIPISSLHVRHRLAVYMDFGVAMMSKRYKEPLIDFNLSNNRIENIDFQSIVIQPLLASNNQSVKKLHPISIGLKWTMLIELPKSVRCKCLNSYINY